MRNGLTNYLTGWEGNMPGALCFLLPQRYLCMTLISDKTHYRELHVNFCIAKSLTDGTSWSL